MTTISKPLAPGISVSTQVAPAAIAELGAAGFRTVINNRPDNEEPGQPTSAKLEAAAHAAGLAYHHIPVAPGQFSEADVGLFRDAIAGCDKPVLAFCKSGMRAASLWALSQAGELTTGEILRQASMCGYDLTLLCEHIEARANVTPGSRRLE